MSDNTQSERLQKQNQLVQKFGLDYVNKQKDLLKKKGGFNTGRLLNSINYRFKVSLAQILVEFVSEDYGKFVDEGRKPGSYPPISKIKEWTKSKGLPEKSAFPIAKNIFLFGIKPKPWINAGKSFEKLRGEFIPELIKIYSKEVITDVKNTFKNKP
mgnify:FL=1